MGISKGGEPTDSYVRGMELVGKQTIFAEGCRGHLTKTLFEKFDLREGKDPQTFAIGIKNCGILIRRRQSRVSPGTQLAGHLPRCRRRSSIISMAIRLPLAMLWD